MAERAAALGAEVVRLKADRLTGLPDTYRDAKTTMAVVVASPSRCKPQPIPPSADWCFDLAEGCPAHCAYCYLAGSPAGPPIVRAYAHLPEILAALPPLLGQGRVSSSVEPGSPVAFLSSFGICGSFSTRPEGSRPRAVLVPCAASHAEEANRGCKLNAVSVIRPEMSRGLTGSAIAIRPDRGARRSKDRRSETLCPLPLRPAGGRHAE
jgi:hypothetical protein